ncbi:MAG: DUF5659 domain-containing protein [Candidatus Woesebacteria bacterium]|nr:DUF5659 domain-containing protein [Candidatus Woesebacteria bacterium]
MNNQEYKTKDLAEASALLTSGQNVIKIDRQGSVCFFVFSDKEKCEEISNKFFFGDLQVNAREFHEAMVRLKNRIFQ